MGAASTWIYRSVVENLVCRITTCITDGATLPGASAVELSKLAGRTIATAQDAREMLGITRNTLRDEKTNETTWTQPE